MHDFEIRKQEGYSFIRQVAPEQAEQIIDIVDTLFELQAAMVEQDAMARAAEIFNRIVDEMEE